MRFDWDDDKNKLNLRKHKISFEEAQTVFFDPLTRIADDPDHSEHERRLIAVGYSSVERLLLVVHCFRENDKVIRIISARKVTATERKQFEEDL